MNGNFGELKERINEWSADDEDILLRKLKGFTDNYIKKSEDLNINLINLNKNIDLIHIDYFNALNSLKNISIKKFVEHVVEEDSKPLIVQPEPKKEAVLLSREEREVGLLNKFKNAISISLEGLNIKNLIDMRDNNDNVSAIDDDNVSITSSRYFSNMHRGGNKNIKLPYIIGTSEFFKSEYLGISNESFERRNTELQGVDLDRKLSNLAEGVEINLYPTTSNIPNNIPNIPNNIPNIPNNIPNIPNNIPNIPNNIPQTNNIPQIPNNISNIQNSNIPVPIPLGKGIIPQVPKVPIIPSLNRRNTTNIPSSFNSSIKLNEEKQKEPENENPINFKDKLNIMFGGKPNTSTIKQVNTTNDTNNMNKEVNKISDNKPKINLDMFIRRNTTNNLISNNIDEEDEDDYIIQKQDNKISKNNLFNNIGITENKPVLLKQMTLPSKPNIFNEEDSNHISNNEILKEKAPNINLEKAKTNLLKMFDDDEEDDIPKSKKINEKTNNINNKLSVLFNNDSKDDKKNVPQIPIIDKKENLIKLPETKNNENKIIKRPLFMEDEDENFNIKIEKPKEILKNENFKQEVDNINKTIDKLPAFKTNTLEGDKNEKSKIDNSNLNESDKNLSRNEIKSQEDTKKSEVKETRKTILFDDEEITIKPKVKEVKNKLEDPLSKKLQKDPLSSGIISKPKKKEDSDKTDIISKDINSQNIFNSEKVKIDEIIKESSNSIKTEAVKLNNFNENFANLDLSNKEELSNIKNQYNTADNTVLKVNRFSDFQNLLGNKLTGMGQASGVKAPIVNQPPKVEENKNYEDIMMGKTSIITKKKPKMKRFGNTMESERESIVNNIETEKITTMNIFEENPAKYNKIDKEVNKENEELNQEFNSEKVKESISQNISIKADKFEEQSKQKINFIEDTTIKIEPAKKSMLFDFSDNLTEKVELNPPKKEEKKIKNIFDFNDEDEFVPVKTKTQETKNEVKKEDKIKFIFDD